MASSESTVATPAEVPATEESAEDRAVATVFDQFSEAWAEIHESIETGLRSVLTRSIDGHRQAIAESGLDGPMPERRADRAERLLTYRHSVIDVADDLTQVFGPRAPASTIAARMTVAMHATVEAVRRLPENVEVPWTADGMAPQPSDGRIRRFRKGVARAFGARRRVGTPRPLPVRAVAQRHLRIRLLPSLDEAARGAAVEWAVWGREFERAWVAWADEILDLLVRAEQAEEHEPEAVWQGAAAAAEALQAELLRLAASVPSVTSDDAVSAVLGPAHGALLADLRSAGGFAYSPSADQPGDWALPLLARVQPALSVLDEGVGTRLALYSILLGVMSGASAVRLRLIHRFADECLEPIRTLLALADEFEGWCRAVPTTGDAASLKQQLEAFRERLATRPPLTSAVPDAEVVEHILDGGAEKMVEALSGMLRQAPEGLALTPPDTTVHPRRPKVEARTLPLQQLARQSFDVLRIERIRLSTVELIDAVERLRANLEELEKVSRFAFDSARDELDGEDPDTAVEHAPKLVADALRNIADSLRQEVAEVEGAFEAADDLLTEEIGDGALALIDRVAAGGVQAQMLAAQSHLTDVWAWAAERWGPEVSRMLRTVRYWEIRLRRLWRRGYRAGSRMVAGGTGEGVASARMVRILADAAAMMRELPPVYQRLFTLEPLTETTFLVGREQELADAMLRWRRFEAGEAGAVVYRGRPGCGMSSFLNALGRQLSAEDVQTSVLRPTARIERETEWTAMVAEAIGVPSVETLDELANAILEAEEGALPSVVMVDNLEHLFMRVPGGVRLLDRTLSFMTETEAHVLWVCGITLSAWQQIETAAPMAVGQMDALVLEALDGDEIRAAVTARHRRSGLPIRYAEPKGRRLLQRRLRKATTPEAVRSVLADDFFEQLAKTSSGHLRLALFQWLQACDFEQGDGGVLVRPPARPDFSALDSLTLTQAFTLKAFLEHRTLTLAEHDRIFRIARSQSAQILESLMNRRLIAAVDSSASYETLSREGDGRYEIHGLLVEAVIAHLRGRNIVH